MPRIAIIGGRPIRFFELLRAFWVTFGLGRGRRYKKGVAILKRIDRHDNCIFHNGQMVSYHTGYKDSMGHIGFSLPNGDYLITIMYSTYHGKDFLNAAEQFRDEFREHLFQKCEELEWNH